MPLRGKSGRSGKSSQGTIGTIGFYGGGMMAEAIIRGVLAKKLVPPSSIFVCDLLEERRKTLSTLHVNTTKLPREMLDASEIIIVAVKPDALPSVQSYLSFEKDKVLISICAGISLKELSCTEDGDQAWVRVMPNLPCIVGEAASAYATNTYCSSKHRSIVEAIMGACGMVAEVPESYMNAVTGLSGSGPAFVFMMIEALTDGGVKQGLPRMLASKLAAQTVVGAGKMAVAFSDTHPAALRNRVESPGGTSIIGSSALESGGFRAAVISAVSSATNRAAEIGKGPSSK